MKIGLIGAFLLTSALLANGQTAKSETSKPTPRSKPPATKANPTHSTRPEVAVPAATSAKPSPTGPTGIGSIKLGMTKEAVLALSVDEPVRIVGELTPTVEKTAPAAGVERFDGAIALPHATEPTKITLTLKDGVLHAITLMADGEDQTLERLAKQVAERYGAGKIQDSRKEEQCIYRNGNSFTLKRGVVATLWSTAAEEGKIVATSFAELDFSMCPSDLRYGTTLRMKVKSLSIRLTEDESSVAPKKNLF
jgi:hypothetical protein